MEEIHDADIEQVSGAGYQEQRALQDFLDRFARERGSVPFPGGRPGPFIDAP